jgi:hypothetical protein
VEAEGHDHWPLDREAKDIRARNHSGSGRGHKSVQYLHRLHHR